MSNAISFGGKEKNAGKAQKAFPTFYIFYVYEISTGNPVSADWNAARMILRSVRIWS